MGKTYTAGEILERKRQICEKIAKDTIKAYKKGGTNVGEYYINSMHDTLPGGYCISIDNNSSDNGATLADNVPKDVKIDSRGQTAGWYMWNSDAYVRPTSWIVVVP